MREEEEVMGGGTTTPTTTQEGAGPSQSGALDAAMRTRRLTTLPIGAIMTTVVMTKDHKALGTIRGKVNGVVLIMGSGAVGTAGTATIKGKTVTMTLQTRVRGTEIVIIKDKATSMMGMRDKATGATSCRLEIGLDRRNLLQHQHHEPCHHKHCKTRRTSLHRGTIATI
jgi:hypothetical protein